MERPNYVQALMNAILDASPRDHSGQPVAVAGEVYDAAMTIAAWAVAQSNNCASPTKTRRFCEEAAKAFRKRIETVQQGMASGQIPKPNLRGLN